MNSLLQYDSSSSDSEDLGVNKTCIDSDVTVSDRHVSNDIQKDQNIKNGEIAIDYFRLFPSKNDEYTEIHRSANSTYQNNGTFETNRLYNMPNTDYEEMWKDSKRLKRWVDPDEPDLGNNKQFKQTSNRVKKIDENIIIVPYKSKRKSLVHSKSMEDLNPVNDESSTVKGTQNREISANMSCRKTFYVVHSKIQPYLFTVNTVSNRVPKKAINRLTGHSGAVNRIKWCKAEYSHLLLSTSMDRTVKIWNVFSTDQSCVKTLSFHQKSVKDADWSLSGRQIISCGFDRTARVSDVEQGIELCVCEHSDLVTCVKHHPVDCNLFVTGSFNILKCWDVRCPAKPIRCYSYKDRIGQIHDLCFLDDFGNTFVSCGDVVARDSADKNIIAWDFASGAAISNQIYHERYTCTRLCKHPHAPLFLAQSHGDYIAQFHSTPPYQMNRCKRFEGHKLLGYDVGCDISPDGRIVATGGSLGQMIFFDFQYAKVLSKKTIDTSCNDIILDVVWHPVLYSTVAIGTWDGQIELWQ